MSVVALYLIFSMLAVLWFDITRYIIPNWLVGLMLAAYPLAVMMAPAAVDWKMAVAGMALVLVFGYGVFAMKWMGAGDIKLLTACALWVGLSHLPDFLLLVGLLGGALALALWGVRKVLPYVPRKPGAALPRLWQNGEPVPYGVAIAGGFLLMLWSGKIPALGA